MSIPPFNELGYLPPGIYEITWAELMERFATNSQRLRLATGLAVALRKLAVAGCRRVLIGGSFVTTKEHPNDFDGWYESFGLDLNLWKMSNLKWKYLVAHYSTRPAMRASFKPTAKDDPKAQSC
jgi:hypothetical protein